MEGKEEASAQNSQKLGQKRRLLQRRGRKSIAYEAIQEK